MASDPVTMSCLQDALKGCKVSLPRSDSDRTGENARQPRPQILGTPKGRLAALQGIFQTSGMTDLGSGCMRGGVKGSAPLAQPLASTRLKLARLGSTCGLQASIRGDE
jgi:hypothetical protein